MNNIYICITCIVYYRYKPIMLFTTCLLIVYGVCYSIDDLWEKYLDVNGVNSQTLKPMS